MFALFMQAKPRPLLIFNRATRKVAWIGEFVGVDIDVLLQILILGKVLATKVADKALEPYVMNHDMPFEAESVIKLLFAVLKGADELIWVILLFFHFL
mgnify:CR=1 FL=1